MSASLDATSAHLRQQPSKCLHMMCGPCGLDVEGKDSEGLTYYLQQHVLSDQHKDKVQKFRDNCRGGHVPAFLMKYRFCCESCSASFTTFNNLTSHSNCPRARFRCVPCSLTATPGDFPQHLRSMTHAKAVATPATLQSEVSTNQPSTVYQNDGEVEEVVDLSNSPPQQPALAAPRPRGQSSQFRQPNLPEGISMTTVPAEPEVSIMDMRPSMRSGRPGSPEDSVMEVDGDSILEMEQSPGVSASVRVRQGPSTPGNPPPMRVRPGPSRPSPGVPVTIRGPPSRPVQRQTPTLTLGPPTNNRHLQRPMGTPPPRNGAVVPRNILYTCQPCKTSFADSGKFQAHSARHEKAGTWAHLHCRVCRWQVQGERLEQAVTSHLFNIQHTVNVAKRSGAMQ